MKTATEVREELWDLLTSLDDVDEFDQYFPEMVTVQTFMQAKVNPPAPGAPIVDGIVISFDDGNRYHITIRHVNPETD